MEATDQDIFDSATNEPAPAPDASQPIGQDIGDTAAAAAEGLERPVGRPDDGHAPHIPAWRLGEVTQERNEARHRAETSERALAEMRAHYDAMQRRMAEVQRTNEPAQELPDMFADPDAFAGHLQQSFDSRMREMELNLSLRLAHSRHGQDFENAYAAVVRAGQLGERALVSQIINSSDPGETLMRWYRQALVIERTGGDLDGFLRQRDEQLLNDPGFMARVGERLRAQAGGTNRPPLTQLPPSLNRLASAGPVSAEGDDLSDAGLFRYATGR